MAFVISRGQGLGCPTSDPIGRRRHSAEDRAPRTRSTVASAECEEPQQAFPRGRLLADDRRLCSVMRRADDTSDGDTSDGDAPDSVETIRR